MKHISKTALETLRFGASGGHPTFLGSGVLNGSDAFETKLRHMTDGERRMLNLQVLRELTESGFIEIVPEPGVAGVLDNWPADPRERLQLLEQLWPQTGALPASIGWWLTYVVTEKGRAALDRTPRPGQ